jgi:hypothetical protein
MAKKNVRKGVDIMTDLHQKVSDKELSKRKHELPKVFTRKTTSLDLVRFLMKWDEKLDREVFIKISNKYYPITGLVIKHPDDNPVIIV